MPASHTPGGAIDLKSIRQIVIGVLAAVGFAYLAFAIVAPFAFDCGFQKLTSAISPDGERVAEVHYINCESAPGPTLELHIVAGKSDIGTTLGPAITNRIGLTWRGDRWLIVSVPPTMDVFDRELKEFRVLEPGEVQ